MNYQYDALNRLTEVDQPWGGSGRNCAYGYDNVDQLTSSTASGNPAYSYHANGNQLGVSAGTAGATTGRARPGASPRMAAAPPSPPLWFGSERWSLSDPLPHGLQRACVEVAPDRLNPPRNPGVGPRLHG